MRNERAEDRLMRWAQEGKPGTRPVAAATVVLLRDGDEGLETLMLRRNSKIAFGGMWVFPGGRVDAEKNVRNQSVAMAVNVIRRRIDTAGIKQVTVRSTEGGRGLLAQLPTRKIPLAPNQTEEERRQLARLGRVHPEAPRRRVQVLGHLLDAESGGRHGAAAGEHRHVTGVLQVEHHMYQLTGMDGALALAWHQLPVNFAAHICIELQNDGSRLVYLSVNYLVWLYQIIDTRDLADLLVERYQRIAKPKHQQGNDGEFAQRLAVTIDD